MSSCDEETNLVGDTDDIPRAATPPKPRRTATLGDLLRCSATSVAIAVVFSLVVFSGVAPAMSGPREARATTTRKKPVLSENVQVDEQDTHAQDTPPQLADYSEDWQTGAMKALWRATHNPWIHAKLQESFAGQWCSAIRKEPLFGSIQFADLCPKDEDELHASNLSTPNISFPIVDPELESRQFARLREYLDENWLSENHTVFEKAFLALRNLSQLEAKDILAFRETWSDIDTELLRKLDNRSGGFVPNGELTTEAIAARLPSVEDLALEITSANSLGVVGGADSLRDVERGPEIDAHAQVVRFNEIVGDRLVPNETGVRTTVHVMCAKVPSLHDPSILEIDLETATPWRTYCGRLHSLGEFANITDKIFMIRPSAQCVLSRFEARSWTRGFLFYWFIGRLIEKVDLYGFSGSGHYNNTNPIYERWLLFEHLFYELNGLVRS